MSLISGIHFEVDMLKVLQPFVSLGLKSFFHAVDTMLHRQESIDQRQPQPQFNFSLNCQGVDSNHRWEGGPQFYRYNSLSGNHIPFVGHGFGAPCGFPICDTFRYKK